MSSFGNLRCHILCTTILLIIVFSSGGCTSWFSLADTTPLTEREEGTGLIIGCIIITHIVINRGRQYPQTMYVDLVYQPTGEKQNKLEIIRVKADSAGYFMLVNIPKGRYAISEIFLDGLYPTIYYPTYLNQEWYRYDSNEPSTSGRPIDIHSWIELDTNGIGNFKYLILANNPGSNSFHDYRGSYYDALEGLRAYSRLNNYKYYRHPVPRYFLDKYPDSEWAPYLRQLIDKP